ncbi:MAG: PLP-dependent aminotransferase family protein [Methanobacteriaceae archaeon]|nr:PLP-dependent aminotransferase family protein [Methanobacteriaceae archaeon]
MTYKFAKRIDVIPRSFVRDILKVTENEEIISFSGGLPNPISFPINEIKKSVDNVLDNDGAKSLQYSTTEGLYELREIIAERYKKYNLKVNPENIMITTGSQQCLDLIGKIFIDPGDVVLVENPTYLAAIQSFSVYDPVFKTAPLCDDGVDLEKLEEILEMYHPKLFYAISNFQNPIGISYSKEKREQLAKLLKNYDTVFVEDNPYGDIRFIGDDIPPIKYYYPKGILFGSFSKIVSPGMHIGWAVADSEIITHLTTVKQGTDLHTPIFTQMIVSDYLKNNIVDEHIAKIRTLYHDKCNLMIKMIKKYFPEGVKYTEPESGMFLWVTLTETLSSLDLFDIAIEKKVAFVPGQAFFANGGGENTMRLKYTNSSDKEIEKGIKSLAESIDELLN